MTNLLKLSVTAILFGAIFIVGINTIADAPDYTVHTENFNTSTYPANIQLSKSPIITGSLVVSNSTWSVVALANNYSINYATGRITTTQPSNMTNNTIFTATYNASQQSSVLNNLVIVVMTIVVAILGLLMILREAGIKIKF